MSTQSLPLLGQPQTAIAWIRSRLLVPSFSDLFFLFVLTWSFVSFADGWFRLLMDGDTGLHIRIGEYILASHQVPTHDLFAFSKPGQTWYAFEWLSEVLFGGLHLAWGLKGVVLLSGIVLSLFVTVLFRKMLALGANPWIALLLTLITANASNIHFHARPHIFTLLFLTIAAWMVQADRITRTRAIWLLVPLTTLWTNLHGGFFILFAYLGILVAGSVAEALLFPELRPQRRSDAFRYGLLTVGCAAASLVNPYGFRLHQHIFETLTSPWLVNAVEEFKSPSFRAETLLAYMAVLFLGLGVSGFLIARRKLTEALWIIFLAYCSLVSVRHVPVFLLVASPIVATQFTALWSAWVEKRPRKSTARILEDVSRGLAANATHTSIWCPAALVVLALLPGQPWPQDFPHELFPTHMVARHAGLIASSRTLAPDQWSDYLVYKNYPRQRVAIDGRHNYYGEKIVANYIQLTAGSYNWKELLDGFRAEAVLCPVTWPLASLLKQDSAWRVVDDDSYAVLFLRRPMANVP